MVKFEVNDGDGDGTGCLRIKVKTDTAKFTNVRIARFGQNGYSLVREPKMFVEIEIKIACRMADNE